MSLVTIKNKYQIVIPQSVRKEAGVGIGDFLEATFERGKIVFQPKSLIDRGIARSLQDIKAGRVFGPFSTANALVASLKSNVKKLTLEKRKKLLR